jgi:hypothetical protein
MVYGTMMHKRGVSHWDPKLRAHHVAKILYKVWNDPKVRARQIVAAVCLLDNIVLRSGRFPIAILEQGSLDLLGC